MPSLHMDFVDSHAAPSPSIELDFCLLSTQGSMSHIRVGIPVVPCTLPYRAEQEAGRIAS